LKDKILFVNAKLGIENTARVNGSKTAT